MVSNSVPEDQIWLEIDNVEPVPADLLLKLARTVISDFATLGLEGAEIVELSFGSTKLKLAYRTAQLGVAAAALSLASQALEFASMLKSGHAESSAPIIQIMEQGEGSRITINADGETITIERNEIPDEKQPDTPRCAATSLSVSNNAVGDDKRVRGEGIRVAEDQGARVTEEGSPRSTENSIGGLGDFLDPPTRSAKLALKFRTLPESLQATLGTAVDVIYPDHLSGAEKTVLIGSIETSNGETFVKRDDGVWMRIAGLAQSLKYIPDGEIVRVEGRSEGRVIYPGSIEVLE